MRSSAQRAEPSTVDAVVHTGSAVQPGSVELQRVSCFVTESLLKRVLRKLFPDERKYERLPVPPLVGYLGIVRASKPYELTDISVSGFCMLTDERWTPGTEMPITLQRVSDLGASDPECFTVQATVVWSRAEGVGFSIVLSEDDSHAMYGNPMRVRWISKAEMEIFLRKLKEEKNPETAGAEISGKREAGSLSPVFQPGR